MIVFRHVLQVLVLLIADVLAFFVSFSLAGLAFWVLHHIPGLAGLHPITPRTTQWLLFPVVIVLFFMLHGLYTNRYGLWEEMRRLYRALVAAYGVIFLFLLYAGAPWQQAAFCVVGWLAMALLVFPVERDLVQRLLYSLRICREPVVLIGTREDVQEVHRALKKEPHLCFQPVAVVLRNASPEDPPRQVDGIPVVDLQDLARLSREQGVNTVVIATPPHSRERISALYAEVSRWVRNILVVPPLRGFAILNAQLCPLFFKNFLMVHHQNRLRDPVSVLIKELADRLFALLLLPLLLPVMAILAFVAWIDTRAWPIFSHERVGKNGKKIRVFKFRTMRKDADKVLKELLERDPEARREWEQTFKLKNDPRVTRYGRFLRKTSLDELPQLFNILKGEMSFVGPRPVLQEELDTYYGENAKFYTQVKPGITGLWQVSGRSHVDYPTRVFLDSWYVLNWSPWLDFMILLKTFKVILLMEGAY